MVPELYLKFTASLRESQHYISDRYVFKTRSHPSRMPACIYSNLQTLFCLSDTIPSLSVHSSPNTHIYYMHMQNSDKFRPCLEADEVFMQNETSADIDFNDPSPPLYTHTHTHSSLLIRVRGGRVESRTLSCQISGLRGKMEDMTVMSIMIR